MFKKKSSVRDYVQVYRNNMYLMSFLEGIGSFADFTDKLSSLSPHGTKIAVRDLFLGMFFNGYDPQGLGENHYLVDCFSYFFSNAVDLQQQALLTKDEREKMKLHYPISELAYLEILQQSFLLGKSTSLLKILFQKNNTIQLTDPQMTNFVFDLFESHIIAPMPQHDKLQQIKQLQAGIILLLNTKNHNILDTIDIYRIPHLLKYNIWDENEIHSIYMMLPEENRSAIRDRSEKLNKLNVYKT